MRTAESPILEQRAKLRAAASSSEAGKDYKKYIRYSTAAAGSDRQVRQGIDQLENPDKQIEKVLIRGAAVVVFIAAAVGVLSNSSEEDRHPQSTHSETSVVVPENNKPYQNKHGGKIADYQAISPE